MKKIFKISCGCLIAIAVILVILIAALVLSNDSDSGSAKSKKPSSEDSFTSVLEEDSSFHFPSVEPIRWERRTADVTDTSARNFLQAYCKENHFREGFDPNKKIFCSIPSSEFDLKSSPSDQHFRLKHANQIRRAALEALLKNLTDFACWLDQSEPVVKKTGSDEIVSSVVELKLRNIVFNRYATARQSVSTKGNYTAISESFSESQVLFYQGRKLLEYTLGEKDEKLTMAPISTGIRGTLSETDTYSMLMPFMNLLISDGLPVKFEYSAYSWDEKKKRGQVALLLIYDCASKKK